MNLKTLCAIFASVIIFGALLPVAASAQDRQVQETEQSKAGQQINDAVGRTASRMQDQQKFRLQYKMQKGQTLRWDVEQIATTDASIAGFDEKSSLRTRSVIAWKVLSVDDKGNITIQDQLESAVEWQKTGEADPISYDSSKDEEVHEKFQATAEKIGKPIATTTIEPSGKIVQRENHIQTMEFGMGKFTLQMPEEPLAIGAQWNIPEELQTRKRDHTIKIVKTRMLYTLRKVENGVATVSFRREVLTPIEDPNVRSQIQQKLNQGSLLFDITKGCITKKTVQWDEKVQGFEGDDSYLHYVGNYSMNLLAEGESLSSSAVPTKSLKPLAPKVGENSSNYIRPRNGKPTLRK